MTAPDPNWDALWNEAKHADMLAVAGRMGAKLRRSGTDFVGACPLGCAMKDGFVLTPAKHLFLCRPSGATGDAVDMVQHVRGCDKRDALAFVVRRDPPQGALGTAAGRRERGEGQTDPDDPERPPARSPAPTKSQRDEEAIEAVLARAKPIEGTHAEAYLRARGIDPQPKLTKDLRFVADLVYWDNGHPSKKLATLPAMVAIIRDPLGAIIGLHKTYLDPETPQKWTPPDGLPAKKIRGKAKSGLIRLGRVGDKLAIGEGIETTLRWHALGVGPDDISLASGLSIDNIAGGSTGTLPHPTVRVNGKPARYPNGEPDPAKPGIVLPDGVREIVLLGDGDSERLATQGKIAAAVRRCLKDGLTVSVHFAPDGKDFADELGDGLPPIEGGEAYLSRIAPDFTSPPSIPGLKPGGKRIQTIMGASIDPQAIDWLWQDWLARGKLHIIAGRPGALKTTTVLGFAAAVTVAGQWPDGSRAALGKVLIWSGEDAIEDTLLPRFMAAGGDRAQVAFVGGVEEDGTKRSFDPSRDIDELAAVCAGLGNVSLVIVDPIVAVAKRDSHKNAETRRDLQPLVDLAERTNAAVVGVHHLTKRSEDADPVDRISGSLAFGAGPRVVLLNALDRRAGGEPRGVLMRAKNNIGPSNGGIGFAAETRPLADYPAIAAQRMLWEAFIDESARDILARLEDKPPEEEKSNEAVFLREALMRGPRMAADVIAEGEAAGFNKKALQRAFKKLGGFSEKPSFGAGWIWELPGLAS